MSLCFDFYRFYYYEYYIFFFFLISVNFQWMYTVGEFMSSELSTIVYNRKFRVLLFLNIYIRRGGNQTYSMTLIFIHSLPFNIKKGYMTNIRINFHSIIIGFPTFQCEIYTFNESLYIWQWDSLILRITSMLHTL